MTNKAIKPGDFGYDRKNGTYDDGKGGTLTRAQLEAELKLHRAARQYQIDQQKMPKTGESE